jgi:hypothetical protein
MIHLTLCRAQPYHDPQDEPAADPLPPHFFDFDHVPEQLSRGSLKGESLPATIAIIAQCAELCMSAPPEMIYEEIMRPLRA